MHRCLLVEDITDIICTALCDGQDGYHSLAQGSVRNVALTCKTLLEPALNALWRVQESFEPLFLVLPESVWDHDSGEDFDFDSDSDEDMFRIYLVSPHPCITSTS